MGKFIVLHLSALHLLHFSWKNCKFNTIYRRGFFLPIINSYSLKLAFKNPFFISNKVKNFHPSIFRISLIIIKVNVAWGQGKCLKKCKKLLRDFGEFSWLFGLSFKTDLHSFWINAKKKQFKIFHQIKFCQKTNQHLTLFNASSLLL